MNSDQTSGSVRVGAIDCGTNSIRLLVADVDATESSEDAGGSQVPGLHDVVREMVITRYGKNMEIKKARVVITHTSLFFF